MSAVAAAPIERAVLDLCAPTALQRRLFSPTTAAFGVVAIVFVALDVAQIRVPPLLQAMPFVLSVLLFGLPHGALDHLVPARIASRITRRRSIAAVVSLYGLLGGVTALLWTLQPVAGFGAFIAVTWFHWGQGDLWLERALGRTDASRLDGALSVAVRGALPMLLPLISHPQDYAAVLHAMTALIDPRAAPSADPFVAPQIRAALAALLCALVAVHLIVRRRRGSDLRVTAWEIAVLISFFVTVPPVLAVGLYFTFWHAVRHIVRLELLEPRGRRDLLIGRLLRPFARFLREALPVTICAIALLLAVALLVHELRLATYLLLISALTTPHTAVVFWMDRRRAHLLRTWRGTDASGCGRS